MFSAPFVGSRATAESMRRRTRHTAHQYTPDVPESFVNNVLPKARAKRLGCLAMKTNAMGGITKARVATIPECLRFAWSQPVDVVISGMQSIEQLEQNVLSCKTFEKMTDQEIAALLARTGKGPVGTEVEVYKKGAQGAGRRPHEDGEPA